MASPEKKKGGGKRKRKKKEKLLVTSRRTKTLDTSVRIKKMFILDADHFEHLY